MCNAKISTSRRASLHSRVSTLRLRTRCSLPCGRERRKKDLEGLHNQTLNVGVLLVSAKDYKLCLPGSELHGQPRLTAEEIGIPRLRSYLLNLPAQRNYDAFEQHIHERLGDIVSRVQRILIKFGGVDVYSGMRKDLTV